MKRFATVATTKNSNNTGSTIITLTTVVVAAVVLVTVTTVVQCDVFDLGETTDDSAWQFRIANTKDHTGNGEAIHDLSGSTLQDIPIILWWTKNIFPHLKTFDVLHCPKTQAKCYTTRDKGFAKHSQTTAFYFYGTEFDPEDLPLPRLPNHIWSLAHEESPLNNFILDHAVAMNAFNYTATYHRAADFPITTLSFPGSPFILNRPPISTELKNRYQKDDGLAPAIYVQSHCEVPSDRDRYVEDLMKFIDIDSYGKCLHNKDLPLELVNPVENMFSSQFKDLIAKYKFVISFENGICDDYMTEKLFRPLHVGSVPVYRGSRLAKEFMPDDNSIIMTDDFASPKELAQFLHQLNDDDEKYEKYLEFKKTKKITNKELLKHLERRPWPFTNDDTDYGPFFEGFECYICEKASKVYQNVRARLKDPSVPPMPPKITDGRKFVCPAPELYRKPDKRDWWFIYDYPEQYWRGLDKARAMRDMLAAEETNSTHFPKYLDKYGRK